MNRRWSGYALLEHDGSLYRIETRYDPRVDETGKGLIELGWSVIPVEIREVNDNITGVGP